jgi:hypothetical protein
MARDYYMLIGEIDSFHCDDGEHHHRRKAGYQRPGHLLLAGLCGSRKDGRHVHRRNLR